MNKSDTIAALALALSKAQGEITNVVADKKGYGYMYADLASVLEITRPILSKYELAVTQLCNTTENGAVTVETVLLHSSGEWLSTSIAVPVSIVKGLSPAQAVGVCITYGRRYALCALIGIAQADEDNDAAITKETETEKPRISMSLATKEQVEKLKNLVHTSKVDKATMQKWLDESNADVFDDMSSKDIQKYIDLLLTKEVKNEV